VTEFKSFNLFLNRMAKKKTTQGIGYINNRSEFDNLVLSVANIIVQKNSIELQTMQRLSITSKEALTI
jgi:hypothetical protein